MIPCSDLEKVLCVTIHPNQTLEETTEKIASHPTLKEEISKNNSSDEKAEPILQNEMNFNEEIFLRDFLRATRIPVGGFKNVENKLSNSEEFFERDFDSLDWTSEIKSIPPRIYVNSNGTLIISGKFEL